MPEFRLKLGSKIGIHWITRIRVYNGNLRTFAFFLASRNSGYFPDILGFLDLFLDIQSYFWQKCQQ